MRLPGLVLSSALFFACTLGTSPEPSDEETLDTGAGATGGGTGLLPGVGGTASLGVGGTYVGAGGTGSGGDTLGSGGDFSPSSGGNGSGGMTASLPADPSPGCSSPSPTLSVSNAIVGLPDGYDGATPVPMIIGFHAANNEHTQLQNRFGNTPIGDEHLMIYLDATGSEWSIGADKTRYETAMTQVLTNGCVDQNRIYAMGHSSGAQFLVNLLCGGETRFDAVIPIASFVDCSSWDPVPALNIHGVDDEERWKYNLNDGDGKKDIVPYRTSNGCDATTVASGIDTAGCSGNISPGCVEFQGCDVRTTWCNHDDPQYDQTNHGIPCFAAAAIYDFLSSL